MGIDYTDRHILWSITWRDAEEYARKNTIVIIPIGSLEAHAWHLPMGTDTFCAFKVALDAARETDSLVTPPVWMGWSIQHSLFPGTITIRPEVLIELVVDICKSLSRNGFRIFILLNGHRITNNPWIQLAAVKAREETGAVVIPVDIAYLAREAYSRLEFGKLGHADEAETSHILYIYPELVDMSKAFEKYISTEELYDPDPRSTKDTILYIPSSPEVNYSRKDITGGGSGNPRAASIDKGRELHEHTVRRLVQLINMLKEKGAKQEL